MPAITAVAFDLDHTLCRPTQAAETIYEGAFDHAGAEPVGRPEDLWNALDSPPAVEDEAGYLAAGFERVLDQYDHPSDPDALATGFLEVVDYGAVEFLPGATDALAAAAEVGPVGLLTNGPERRQAPKLATLGIERAFDAVVYAGDMDNRKPHRDPFDRTVESLGVDHGETLYVGDSLEYDVAGAQGAGLQAAWHRNGTDDNPVDHTPEYVLDSVGDLVDLLEGVPS